MVREKLSTLQKYLKSLTRKMTFNNPKYDFHHFTGCFDSFNTRKRSITRIFYRGTLLN